MLFKIHHPTAQALHPASLHVNKSLFARDTLQSRLPDPKWLAHWFDAQICLDAARETKGVERILHNPGLLLGQPCSPAAQPLLAPGRQIAAAPSA